MATPLRKKRNFKALQLAVAEPVVAPATAREPEPVAMRQAPVPAVAAVSAPVERKKRPPPMVIKAPKIPNSSGAVSAVEQDTGLLTVTTGGNGAPQTASHAVRRNTYHATLSNTLANLDMNAEIKFDLKNEDLKDLHELGQGNGGSVKKVEHVPTKTMMAKKASAHNTSHSHTDFYFVDRADRCQTLCPETNTARASNNARLPFQVYYLVLRRLPSRS